MMDSKGRDTMLRSRGSRARLVLGDDRGEGSECLKRRVKLGAGQEGVWQKRELPESHQSQQRSEDETNPPRNKKQLNTQTSKECRALTFWNNRDS